MLDDLYDLALRSKSGLPSPLLRRLYDRAQNARERNRIKLIGARPDLPEDIAVQITTSRDVASLSAWLAQNDVLPEATLLRLLDGEERITILALIAGRDDITPPVAAAIAATKRPAACFALLTNDHVADDLRRDCVPALVEHAVKNTVNPSADDIGSHLAKPPFAPVTLACERVPYPLIRRIRVWEHRDDPETVARIYHHTASSISLMTSVRFTYQTDAYAACTTILNGAVNRSPGAADAAKLLLDTYPDELGTHLLPRLQAAVTLTERYPDIDASAATGTSAVTADIIELYEKTGSPPPDGTARRLVCNPTTAEDQAVGELGARLHGSETSLPPVVAELLASGQVARAVALLAGSPYKVLTAVLAADGFDRSLLRDAVIARFAAASSATNTREAHEYVLLAVQADCLEAVPMSLVREATRHRPERRNLNLPKGRPEAAAAVVAYLNDRLVDDVSEQLLATLWDDFEGTLEELAETCRLLETPTASA